MSEKTEHAQHVKEQTVEEKAKHAAEHKAQLAAEKKTAAKKKRFSGSTLLAYLATLTPAELAKVCSLFDIPCGSSVLTKEGAAGQVVASHPRMWENLKNLEDAYKLYGDELCDTICDYMDLLAGKPVPVEEK